MNGNWNLWGQRPYEYVMFFRKIHDAVKAIAPKVAFTWAPSSSNGCME
jgi:SpoU rRNA methylase family enzyme